MNIAGICVIAVAGAILAVTLKQTTPNFSVMLALITGVIILITICVSLPTVTSKIESLMNSTGVNAEYTTVLLKSVGICFICQFSSDICKDAGQNALSGKVELAGKILILISALPLMEEVLNTATSLLGG
ncbi:MAG: stage III sporulation protein AD [Acutalibacteraceae bacterium]|nr:stage III sporulation protein AD [Acutalibacteraceae bacterium]